MANGTAMLDKLTRNMKQRGLTAEIVGTTVEVTKTGGDILTVSYVDKSIQAPMGGVSDATSPFLGIGVVSPGSMKIKGEAGENTIAAIVDTTEALSLMNELSKFANDIVVEAGDSTTELARIAGHAHLLGLGTSN